MAATEGSLTETPAGARAGWVQVAGARIRWYRWGDGEPVVLLIHGGGANSSWWFDTVAALGPRQTVVAFDLSGHGDSGERDEYSIGLWADEAEAVVDRLGGGDFVIVAHSMGGRVAVVLASRLADRVRGLVLLDSVLPTHDEEPVPRPTGKRVYPSLEEAVNRFRLVPGDDSTPAEARERLARASIEGAGESWTWKFDPRVFEMPDAALVNESIAGIRCPVVMLHASESPVTAPAMAAAFEALLGRAVDYRLIEGVGHHFMVDRPELTAELLAGYLRSTRPL